MAGYTDKLLKDKLGIEINTSVAIINPPDYYPSLLGLNNFDNKVQSTYDFIQYFTKEKSELENDFPKLKSALQKSGMIWISWPKKSSKVATDLDENIIRGIGLENGLVDVKVAAIDATWSGLKFVFRLQDR